MANWCNIRLSAIGPREDIAVFRKDAGPLKRGDIVDASRSKVFLPEMQYAESGELLAHGTKPFARRFERLEFTLQGRNTDHADHFTGISARYPSLAFVLAYGDPNGDSHGSWLLLRGVPRAWEVPKGLHRAIMRKHYKRWKLVDKRGWIDYDAAEADDAEWDGYFEMMDVAAAHWDDKVVRWLRKQHPPRRKARRIASS